MKTKTLKTTLITISLALSLFSNSTQIIKAQETPTTNTPPHTQLNNFNVNKYLNTSGQSKVAETSLTTVDIATGKTVNKTQSVALIDFIIRTINVLTLTIGSVSLFLIIVGGMYLLTSHGDTNAISKGKDIIKYAIIGLIVTLSSYYIIAFAQNLLFTTA